MHKSSRRPLCLLWIPCARVDMIPVSVSGQAASVVYLPEPVPQNLPRTPTVVSLQLNPLTEAHRPRTWYSVSERDSPNLRVQCALWILHLTVVLSGCNVLTISLHVWLKLPRNKCVLYEWIKVPVATQVIASSRALKSSVRISRHRHFEGESARRFPRWS